jgi:hypothetical protein
MGGGPGPYSGGSFPALGALAGAFQGAGQSMQSMLPLYMQYTMGPKLQRLQAYQQRGIYFHSPEEMEQAEQDKGTPGQPASPENVSSQQGNALAALAGAKAGLRPPTGTAGTPASAGTPPAMQAIMQAQQGQAEKGGIHYDPGTGMPTAQIPGPEQVGGASVYPYFPPTQIPSMFGRGGMGAVVNANERATTQPEVAAINAASRERVARTNASSRVTIAGNRNAHDIAVLIAKNPLMMEIMSQSGDPDLVQLATDLKTEAQQQIGGPSKGVRRPGGVGNAGATTGFTPQRGETVQQFVQRAQSAGEDLEKARAAWNQAHPDEQYQPQR